MDKTPVLAGDIGGTKASLGLFLKGKNRPELLAMESFSSRNSPDLETLIRKFLRAHPSPVSHACFGIAGPVANGESKVTNLPWRISEERIRKQFAFRQVRLVNDLTAMAMAIPLLRANECFPLNQMGSPQGRNLALIAPGTGLGQSILIYQRGRYLPVPSEGGHADFAPANDVQMMLWQYLYRRYGHVSIERVLSGSGLANIYEWLRDSGRLKDPERAIQKLKEIDPAKAIAEAAMADKDPGCGEALNMFVSIFGAVAGNLALTGMTTGGVYLGGGISPKILPKLKENIFMQAFTNKGRFKGLLEKIPISVILNDTTALIGAACFAGVSMRT